MCGRGRVPYIRQEVKKGDLWCGIGQHRLGTHYSTISQQYSFCNVVLYNDLFHRLHDDSEWEERVGRGGGGKSGEEEEEG